MTTKTHTSLAFFNDNTKKAFRSLLKQLDRSDLTVYKAIDAEGDKLNVTKDTDVLDIMDHCFATETYTLIVKHQSTVHGEVLRASIYGHLDGCTESMFANYGFPVNDKIHESLEGKIIEACDSFNDINEDLNLD
tara:strand:- start:688 stop:1089 length:402 start_codon:yes stop_codon:yes gene_type:complete